MTRTKWFFKKRWFFWRRLKLFMYVNVWVSKNDQPSLQYLVVFNNIVPHSYLWLSELYAVITTPLSGETRIWVLRQNRTKLDCSIRIQWANLVFWPLLDDIFGASWLGKDNKTRPSTTLELLNSLEIILLLFMAHWMKCSNPFLKGRHAKSHYLTINF